MKATHFAKSAALLGLAAAQLTLTGCVTNGDPTTGGIFWSERANNQRLQGMQSELDAINADNARQLRKQKALESQL